MDKTGRRPRIHIPNTFHHVMVRGNNRQKIFYGNEYYAHFLKLLDECSKQFDHKIIAYCLMSNHVHLLIHIHESSLSLIMKNINHRYARWCNQQQNRIGHLFQGRFRSIEVKDNHYFVNLCRYIHLNPVSAKLMHSIDAYPWSSHHYYVSNYLPSWMDTEFMHTTINQVTGLDYLNYMSAPIDKEAWRPMLYIGDTGEIVHEKSVACEIEGKIETGAFRNMLPGSQVVEIICAHLKIRKERLLHTSRIRQHCNWRVILAYYLLEYTTMNLSDIGKLYKRSLGTLSRQISKFRNNRELFISHLEMKNIEQILNQLASK